MAWFSGKSKWMSKDDQRKIEDKIQGLMARVEALETELREMRKKQRGGEGTIEEGNKGENTY